MITLLFSSLSPRSTSSFLLSPLDSFTADTFHPKENAVRQESLLHW